ncbi:MAG: hypothetical protein ACOVQ4_09125 [Flectobacillus sp.]|uniref:hypothetical protein n=1 Tax=Flectobacillus sp. TaxID=50419 RepID=UPI003B9D7057
MAKKSLAEKMAANSQALLQTLKPNTINSFSSTETIKKNIVILDELRDLIPPLLESEYLALKDNLIKHGCKDPLKIWRTSKHAIGKIEEPDEEIYVLIDGHNRYKLCTELGISFNIQIDNFESLKDVRDFMIDFQLSRRNITPQQASYLRGLRYNSEKKELADNLKGSPLDKDILPNGQNVHLAENTKKTTAQELGEYFNVDEKTIRRDAEFAKGLEKLAPTFRKEILNGKVKVEKSKIQKLGKATDITHPITSVDGLLLAYNQLITPEQANESAIPEKSRLELQYENLNKHLLKACKTKKMDKANIQKLKEAFEEFLNTITSM